MQEQFWKHLRERLEADARFFRAQQEANAYIQEIIDGHRYCGRCGELSWDNLADGLCASCQAQLAE